MLVKREWEENLLHIDEDLEDFLQQRMILGQMFPMDPTLFRKEFEYLHTNNRDYLELFESPTEYGSPTLFTLDGGKKYNPNDIHHLYHFCRYENAVGKIDTKQNILEWGGGYGNMCKVLHMVLGDLIESYTIVDLPKLTNLTKKYVKETTDLENFNQIEMDSSDSFTQLADMSFDMFLSTWALSESPKECAKFLDENGLLDSERLLVAIHQCGNHIPYMDESTNLRNILKNKDTTEEDVSVIDGINYYIFK